MCGGFRFRSEGVSRSEGIRAGSVHREGENGVRGGLRSEGVSMYISHIELIFNIAYYI